MTTYTLKGRITEDHRLEVDLPEDAPPGEAEIVITPTPVKGSAAALLELIARWDREPTPRERRLKEEIDAEINAMRDEWDRD